VTAAGTLAPRVPQEAVGSDRLSSGLASVYRAERRKLAAQLSTRLLALLCGLGPFSFAAVLGAQSGSPADTLFGVWVHSSGFAVSLVVLGFAGSWGFPLVAGVLAGDMFSAEDRYGTWKTVLTRSCTREHVFAGKVLAAMTFSVGLLALTAISSLAVGLLLVGDHSLVGLGGQLLSPGRCLVLVTTGWMLTVLPVLAFTSLAVLFSVATRNGIAGVIGPAIVALLTQLLGLVGTGVWAHMLLIGSTFDLWHGLFAARPFYGPLAVATVVSILWITACLGISWWLLRRRDFAGTHVTRPAGWVRPVRLVAVIVSVVALLALAGNWGPVGVTAARVQASLTPAFNNISLLQQRLIGRIVPAGAKLDVVPYCNRHSGPRQGPGDWSCTLNVFIPQPGKVPFQETPVTYDVSVQANGCYKAQSPPAFVGQQTIRDARGETVVNPLFVVYGCFNPL
jgi:ABC-2 type transport system permease protein